MKIRYDDIYTQHIACRLPTCMKTKIKRDLRTWWRKKYFDGKLYSKTGYLIKGHPNMEVLRKISLDYKNNKKITIERKLYDMNQNHCILEQLWAVSERLVDL